MAAIHHIDNEKKILLTIWEGPALDIELIKSVKNYQEEIQNNPDYAEYNEVVDFSDVTSIKLTTEGIKGLANIASLTDKKQEYKKLALIVSSNLAFGFARMYEAYRGFSRYSVKEVRVFKSRGKAFEWIEKN
ncbi:hypothetical protein MNBD_GAMMA09-2120 [hydrothermal vent metagenome]|uniref:STAS/SEC14 domain-containing protein n=1 Tax=hydrothermal vent metagenome TaxID=652676 RepID=A0A3B0XS99_9ZZZZ